MVGQTEMTGSDERGLATTGAPPPEVSWDALVLAGGRARRLDGRDKAGLTGPDGRTCLARALAACDTASLRVVVGPPRHDHHELSVWEDPPFSGPARAIAAGLAALDAASPPGAWSRWVLALACDMPGASRAVPPLLEVARLIATGQQPSTDGVVSLDQSGHRQWLCALYDRVALRAACAQLPPDGSGESARQLVRDFTLITAWAPPGACDDIDTEADMRAWGFSLTPDQTPDQALAAGPGFPERGHVHENETMIKERKDNE